MDVATTSHLLPLPSHPSDGQKSASSRVAYKFLYIVPNHLTTRLSYMQGPDGQSLPSSYPLYSDSSQPSSSPAALHSQICCHPRMMRKPSVTSLFTSSDDQMNSSNNNQDDVNELYELIAVAAQKRQQREASELNRSNTIRPSSMASSTSSFPFTETEERGAEATTERGSQQSKKRRRRRQKLKHYGQNKAGNKINTLSGFFIHSITPQESSILNYTSITSPGTYTEYHIVVENVRTGEIWQVARRYSSFLILREALAQSFQSPHCHYCANMIRDMHQLAKKFPGKRLWGSSKPAVVQNRAERFLTYLQELLEIGTNDYQLSCRLVSDGYAVQLRNFLTMDSESYKGIPGKYGQEIPSLLREMSVQRSAAEDATLTTIQEDSVRSSSAQSSTFDEEDEGAQQHVVPEDCTKSGKKEDNNDIDQWFGRLI